MATEWFYESMGKVIGPLSSKDFHHLAQLSRISPDDFIRKGVDGRWVKASQVKNLFATPGMPTVNALPKLNEPRKEKACDYCGEAILEVARKCKHCGEFLDGSKAPAKQAPPQQGKVIFKASKDFIGLLCSYHIKDSQGKVLAKMKPGESFELSIDKNCVMYVKYKGGFGEKSVNCFSNQINKFSISLSQSGLGCVVSRIDVIDSD